MIDTNKHPLHRVQLDGPHTKDSQEHQDWEDAETLRRLSVQRDAFSVAIKWARWTFFVMLISAVVGIALSAGIDLSNLHVSKQ